MSHLSRLAIVIAATTAATVFFTAHAGPIADAYSKLDDATLFQMARDEGIGHCKVKVTNATRMGISFYAVKIDDETASTFNTLDQDAEIMVGRFVRELILKDKCISQ
jgi:hypothetical protein